MMTMKSATLLFCAFAALASHGARQSPRYTADWESLNTHRCPEWFSDAKFGIFIHWGPYSVPAYAPLDRDRYAEHFLRSLSAGKPGFAEHLASNHPGKSYFDLAAELTAHDFDAGEWAAVFRRAGARYAVLTSKHHDGFCLWPSAQQPYWNSVCLGAHRDIVGEFMKGMREHGLKAGLYYSLCENHDPLYKAETIDRFVDEVNLPQLKDLVTTYRPDIVWPDGEWDFPVETHRGAEFLAWLLNESPVKDDVAFNDRWGKKRRGTIGDFYTTEYGHNGANITPEFYCHPWEECRGIAGSFGFNAYEGPDEYMSAAACVHLLVRTVAFGGNLLLNVGPDKEGRIPPIMRDRLFAVGDWLAVNGEAIYKTRYNPKRFAAQGVDGFYETEAPDAVYAIATVWPERPFTVRDVGDVTSVALLGSDVEVAFERRGRDIVVTPPALSVAALPCAHAWTFRLRRSEPGALGNSACVFSGEKRGVVAFAAGFGRTAEVKAYLARRFPATAFTFIEQPVVPGGTSAAAMCFGSDVVAKGAPDLLFMPSLGSTPAEARGAEGMIRAVREANSKSDVAVAGAAVSESGASLLRRYGVVGLGGGDIVRALDEAFAKPARWPSCRHMPRALDPMNHSRGKVNPLWNVEMNSRWFKGFEYSREAGLLAAGEEGAAMVSGPVLRSCKPGEEINLFFHGTALGLFVVTGPDCGVLKIDIDGHPRGGTVKEFDLYSEGARKVAFLVAADGLEKVRHRAVISVSGRKNARSSGHAVRICRIAVNGVVPKGQGYDPDPAQPAAGM